MRSYHEPPASTLADLTYQAEMLYDDLKRAGLVIEAASVYEALTDLRRRVREESEE